MTCLVKVVRLFHVDQSGIFSYKNENKVLGLISLSTMLPEPYKNPMLCLSAT